MRAEASPREAESRLQSVVVMINFGGGEASLMRLWAFRNYPEIGRET